MKFRLASTHMIVALILLAGCSSSTPGAPGGTPSADHDAEIMEPSASKPGPEAPTETAAPPTFNFTRIILEECHSHWVISYIPHGLWGEIVPPEWADKNPIPYSTLWYLAAECERFSWGPFERGPISFVFEWHSHFSAPLKCDGGPRNTETLTSRVLVSDPEVAAALRDRLGFDVVVGTYVSATTSTDGMDEHRSTWIGAGGFSGEFTLLAEPDDPSLRGSTIRTYAVHKNGVTAIDFEERRFSAGPEIPLARASFGEGTLYAQTLGAEGVVLGDPYYDQSFTGTVQTWDTITCDS